MALGVPTTISDFASASAGAAGSITCNKPTNVADGDLLVAWVYYRNSASTPTPPSGWVQQAADTSGQSKFVYTKVIPSAAAETPTSYTWSFTGGSARTGVIIFRVTGADLSTPIDAVGTWEAGPTSTMVLPAVTAVASQTMLLECGVAQTNTTTPSVFTAPATSATLTQISWNNGSAASSMWVGFESVAASGATGTRTATLSPNAASGNGIMLTISPVPSTPPTAAFTHSEIGLDIAVDGTSSTAQSPATLSSYDWDWGDGSSHGTGSTASHTYAIAGTQTVTLTVTDSNSQTNSVSHSITITTPGTQASPTTTTTTTGFTSNSGTVLNAITDLTSGAPNLTTFVSGGNGSILRGAISPIAAPGSGSPFLAILAVDRNLASSGSITAKLYEKDGTTLRSTATAAIPDMTASGGNAGTLANQYVQVAWPWTDVQNVTDWNQLVYEFTFTVS